MLEGSLLVQIQHIQWQVSFKALDLRLLTQWKELSLQIRTSGAKFVFASAETLSLVLEASKAVGISEKCVFLIDDGRDRTHNAVRGLNDLLSCGEHQWEQIDDLKMVVERWADKVVCYDMTILTDDRTAVLNFSSGTSGPPKACMMSHHNLVANAEQSIHLDRMARLRKSDLTYATRDVHCAYAPLYHASKYSP